MERKLELWDISGYLPYGLKMKFAGTNDIRSDEAKIIKGVKFGESFYPILLPLSDLYKTITHNGKEIVPIVELAKISYENNDWFLNSHSNAECENYIFDYSGRSFWCIDAKKQYTNRVYFQIDLFDFMNELKIDYRGLIDSDLAISVYDLPENPYE